MKGNEQERVVIIGGGPSGLTAGYQLADSAIPVTVLEKHSIVGGIARTESYKGFSFDMGGHRFFSKSKAVNDFWDKLLADRFLTRPRQSRIYYRRKFFDYPLRAINAFRNLGIIDSSLIMFSWLRWQAFPYREETTFEQWVTNRFGKRLFKTFFESYTEKVWGISCSELSADWAAQRIKGLSLKTAVLSALGKKDKGIKTLIESFKYPEKGPGMMWEEVASQIVSKGSDVRLNANVTRIHRTGNKIAKVETVDQKSKVTSVLPGTDFISSMPLSELVLKMDPPAPEHVRRAAEKLSYRDFLTVCLIVNVENLFSDNWIYIHDSNVKVGRIQNYKNWSPKMVPNQRQSSLGLEYFCNEGDSIWNMPDQDLVELAKQEMQELGLLEVEDVVDGCVFRVEKSYPVYDSTYREHVAALREFVGEFDNLQTIGRNGLHRYNNQDHAMITGFIAAENIVNGTDTDVWAVNEDKQYHEELSTAESEQASLAAAQAPELTPLHSVPRNAAKPEVRESQLTDPTKKVERVAQPAQS
ncbi:MAG: NAD(P)/FAD-dependent oxidoreductase [Planctomycetaceae bacterium]|nr:NAD(P)/FAD-dependent oxidoreductase [Planctomycetaceae bacterium]